MPKITITCPHCRYSRDCEQSAIPAGVTEAGCPQCRQRFNIAAAICAAASVEPAGPAPELPPSEPPPPEISPPAVPRPAGTRRLRFSFTGTGRNYFGIWIVNTMLKIVTLGVYSAWAKVRKRRFFYGNTRLNNAALEYLADPMALFKGWLIAAVFFVLYSVGSKVSPLLSGILGLILFFGMPWLIVRSRVFNMRNSAHSNIRFTFNPAYSEAYVVFAGFPCLLPFTLGLIAPYMVYRQKKFFVENSGYGCTRCTFDATVKDFYLVFLKAAGWLVLLALGFFFAVYFISATAREFAPLFMNGTPADRKLEKKGVIVIGLLVLAILNFLYLFIAVYVRTALANLTWNGTRIKNSRFVSTLRISKMAWLYLSSGLAIFLSFGLLIPWASVRITHYRLANLYLDLKDDPEGFQGWGQAAIGSAGEEIGDMFGIDVGL